MALAGVFGLVVRSILVCTASRHWRCSMTIAHFGLPVPATDMLLGVGTQNATAQVRGTLAFATLFFGPMASNNAVDQAGFDAIQGEEDGDIQFEDPTMKVSTVAFYRRNVTLAVDGATGKRMGYDPDRNLTRARMHYPRGNDCGSEYVECVPGPCSIWEYDYQFAGLQMSQQGPVTHRLMHPYAVLGYNENISTWPSLAATNDNETMEGFNKSLYYPMVGIVRCGPLFNYRYINNTYSTTKPGSHTKGQQFNPNSEPPPTKKDEMDVTSTLTPIKVPQETYDYLPQALPDDVEVYPVPGQASIPVPHGINLNPRWYYKGYSDCFSMDTGAALDPKSAQNCNLLLMVMNWLYNTDPGELICQGKSAPPYAPAMANPDRPEETAMPWSPNDAAEGADPDGPAVNENPANHTYTGNPRLQRAYMLNPGDSDAEKQRRAALIGYTRGNEDGYIVGESLDVTKYKVIQGATEHPKSEHVTLEPQHWDNGKGPNHRITPQELPGDYTPGTCDFTQCRWVPTGLKHHTIRRGLKAAEEIGATTAGGLFGAVMVSEHAKKLDLGGATRLAKPPSAAYAVAASELSIPPPDPLLIGCPEPGDPYADPNHPCWCNSTSTKGDISYCHGDAGNQAFQSYKQSSAFKNKVRAYGWQEIVFRRDVISTPTGIYQWVMDPGLQEFWEGRDISTNATGEDLGPTKPQLNGTLNCTTHCFESQACRALGFGGGPCNSNECNDRLNNESFCGDTGSNDCTTLQSGTEADIEHLMKFGCYNTTSLHYNRPICCAKFEPYGIIPGGQLVSTEDPPPANGPTETPLSKFEKECAVGGSIAGKQVGADEAFQYSSENYNNAPGPPTPATKPGCINMYTRTSHMEILTSNPGDHSEAVGKCRYNKVSEPLTSNEYRNAIGGQRTVPCYGMLGSHCSTCGNDKRARQAVAYHEHFEKHGGQKQLSSDEHHFEWSRATAINGAGFKRHGGKDGQKFDAPTFTPMACTADQDAFFYELGTHMNYLYKGTRYNMGLFDVGGIHQKVVTFDYRHNFMPTRNSLNDELSRLWKRWPDNFEATGLGRMFHERLAEQCGSAGACGLDGAFGSECNIWTFNDLEQTDKQTFQDVETKVPDVYKDKGCTEKLPMGGTGKCAIFSNYNSDTTVPPTYEQNPKDSKTCGILVMMAPFKSRRTVGKYRPNKAYYQETRSVFPDSTIDRSAAFLNTNEISDSWGCNCDKQDIVWRWWPLPDDKQVPAPPKLREAQALTYATTEVVIRSFAWKDPPNIFTQEVGLFLPSGRPKVVIRERDFLHEMRTDARDDPTTLGDRAKLIMPRFAGQDAPDFTTLPDMIFQGNETKDKHRVFPDLHFTTGSCLRWPYGQVPRLGLTDSDRNTLYPNETKTTYGMEAAMAYCETISPHRSGRSVQFSPTEGKLQSCFRDPMTPRQRFEFCQRHQHAALHVIYGLQIVEQRRTLSRICSTEHKTCLIVPGRKELSSLEAVLHAHHKHHRNHPETGEGYTFLVTPFNSSIFGILLGQRYTSPVGQGHDFQLGPFTRVPASSANLTGIPEHQAAFDILNQNDHTAEQITTAMTALYKDLVSKKGAAAGCPDGEVRIPGRTERRMDATECVNPAEYFKGSPEAGATVHFDFTNIQSAVDDVPLTFQKSKHHLGRCVRITVSGADNVTVGNVVADQSDCITPGTVVVLTKRARSFHMPNLTVIGEGVASAVAILTAHQGKSTDVSGGSVGITFQTPPLKLDYGFFRAALAASGAVWQDTEPFTLTVKVNNDGNNVVLMPTPGSPDMKVSEGPNSAGLHIVDLRNSIAEFAHGTLKKLYATDAVGLKSWVTTVSLTALLGTVLALLLATAIFQDVRVARKK